MKQGLRKSNLLVAGGVLTAYLFIYFICRQFFFIGQPYYLYTLDWTAKNILWIAALISAVPALFGKIRYAFITLGGYLLGLLTGELFGAQMVAKSPSLPPVPVHYGFAWCIGVFLLGCIIGILVERMAAKKHAALK